MGLINEQPQDALTPLEKKVRRIKAINTQIYQTMLRLHSQAFSEVWKDKTLTPSDIVAAFGTDAAALFQNSSQIQAILAAVNPDGYVPLAIPDRYTVTPNPDGTVTVTDSEA